MSFIRAIFSAIRNYFNFSGRSNRREFWFWIGFAVLAWLGLLQTDLQYVPDWFDTGYMKGEEGAPRYLSDGWIVFCIIPTISLMVRRLHDNDRAWYWLLSIVPALWWFAAKGTKGPNRYG